MMKVISDVGASVAAGEPLQLDEVVARTGLQARYVEEWLAGMVAAGYLTYDPEAHTYTLPEEHAYFLASEGTDHFLGGLYRGLPRMLGTAPRVATAFEQGGGVMFQDYGDEFPHIIEHTNRGQYEQRLVPSWPTMPEVVARLQLC